MAEKLFLELVSPEQVLVSGEVDEIIAQGSEGQFGVLAGHAPFFTSLVAGGFTYLVDNVRHHVFVSKGFLEVTDDKIVVLAESATKAHEIDVKHAKELVEKTSAILADKSLTPEREKEAQAIIDTQLARIAVAEEVNS